MPERARVIRRVVVALAAVLGVAALARWAWIERPPGPRPDLELWLYYAVNLADGDEVARLESVWRRAAAAGYRHVMLADTKFARLGEMNADYFENARRVKRLGAELGLEIVPGVFQLGRSSSLLAPAPDLAEALPVRDALFEARGGIAHLVSDPPVAFGPKPELVDAGVAISGGRAVSGTHRRPARFMYRVRVHPHRSYHVSVAVRTAGYTGNPLIEVLARGRQIQFTRTLGVRRDQDWTTHDIQFNSLEHSEALIYFGGWRPARGTLEWKDWRIEEVGPVNVVRRAGAPCTARGAVEGVDFGPVSDPRLGTTPWRGQFDSWHEPPPIPTTLPDGKRFRLSWHHAGAVYGSQVMACVSEPALQDLLADEARRMRELWEAPAYLMMIDEIRVMNRDSSCIGRGLSPGALLAEQARRCRELLPGARVLVWNDMFDPHHNAVRDYDLVNGDLAGAWEGLAPEVVVVNWNGGRARASLRFFAGRGHPQILAAYYDGRPRDVRNWFRAARGVEGVIGVMYTTWQSRFDDLEAFARECRGS